MSRAPRAVAALAAVLLAAPAGAYLRTADKLTGQPLAWPLPVVPWHLNHAWLDTSPSCAATTAVFDPTLGATVVAPRADPVLAAVRASFAEWEQPCTDLRLLYAGESSELRVGAGGAGGNVVVFRRGWCSQNPAIVDPITHAVKDACLTAADGDCGATYDCFQDSTSCVGSSSCTDWAVVALTSVLYDPTTGRIMSADIELNGWDGGVASILGGFPPHGWYFTCYPGAQPPTCTRYGDPGCSYIDLQNTVTHEIGHFLGLAHPCGGPGLPDCGAAPPPGEIAYHDRTMLPTTTPGDIGKRTLSTDDVDGVCAIYPSPVGGCGCGAGAGAGALSLLLVALALRPRRRPSPAPLRGATEVAVRTR